MSKDKPEVGDVWETSFAKYVILQNKKNGVLCLVSEFRLATFNHESLLRVGKYLGKSKVSIKELFDVKD